MTRPIRVKASNQAAIIAALIEAGYTAQPTATPCSEQGYELAIDYPSRFEEIINQDKKNMAGVLTSASGNQAHKVISDLKTNGKID